MYLYLVHSLKLHLAIQVGNTSGHTIQIQTRSYLNLNFIPWDAQPQCLVFGACVYRQYDVALLPASSLRKFLRDCARKCTVERSCELPRNRSV